MSESSRANTRRLLSYLWPHKSKFMLSLACMVVVSILDVSRSGMIIPLTDLILTVPVQQGQSPASPPTLTQADPYALPIPDSVAQDGKALLNRTGGVGSRLTQWRKDFAQLPKREALLLIIVSQLVIVLLLGVFDFSQEFLLTWLSERTVFEIRRQVFSKLIRLSVDYFNKNATGRHVSHVTNDVLLIGRAIATGLGELLVESIRIIVFATTLLVADWRLALMSFVVLPLLIWPFSRIGRKVKRVSAKFQTKMADLNSVLFETISGIRVVKAFAMEEHEMEKFQKENTAVFKTMVKSGSLMALLTPVMDMAGTIGACLVIWYASNAVMQGRLGLPILLYFIAGLSRLIQPMKKLSRVNARFQQALAASDRIFGLLDTPSSVTDGPYSRKLTGVQRGVEFKDVWFTYGDEENMVLKNISLSVSVGEAVAIIGPSGSGKTTVLNLLLRFYDAKEGVVAIDGTDIRDFTLESLLQNLSMVSQESMLFNDTIRNNILYGNPKATFADVVRCAQGAHAEEFIRRLPNGYDTMVGERGASLSGGQRQRICIARAMLKDAPILLLDEATSELDSESEVVVREAIANLMKEKTTITVAHRLSTVLRADRIVVMEKGRVVDVGTHEDLKTRSQFYQRVVELQSI